MGLLFSFYITLEFVSIASWELTAGPNFFCKLAKFYCATFAAIFKSISATVFDLFAFSEPKSTFSYVKSEKYHILKKNEIKVPIDCIISKIIKYILIRVKFDILNKFKKK